MSTENQNPAHQILAPGVAEGPEFAHVREMFAGDNATAAIGATVTKLEVGHCEGHFTVESYMCNGHGTAQGGYLYMFADSIFAGACNAAGEVAVAAYNSIHYIAPAFAGDVVDAVGITRQTWGRNGVVDVALSVKGKPIAEFRGTFRVIPAKPASK
ncbi:hotdog domain-containing protein [Corynebacterium sp.]|uniref:hotdog domain-containing protein n=1 Tax=Corynebacterium sp. TaxID=1720 RepID=UPI0026DD72C7|nr:hotdog domain-containing protein [Corynebacterium sp.]MDO5032631.1 hotdog domain-containing protein [Corynebacterium sp.]